MSSWEYQAEKAEEVGDLGTALDLWRAIVKRDRDAVFFCRYGQVARKLERWEEAHEAFTEALRLNPQFPLAMELMGSLWLSRTDNTDDKESFRIAKEWFLKAAELDRSARVLTFLANTYSALEDRTAACAALEGAIKVDANYEEALYNLAFLEEEIHPHRSLELLERAIQIDPDYLLAHQVLGRLAQRADDLVRAEYHFRRSLEIAPADYLSNLYLANLLGVQGRHAEAEQTYSFATSLHPEIRAGFDFYANFLDSIGKHDQAVLVRKRAQP